MSQRFAGYVNKVGANIKLEIIKKNCTLGGSKIVKESPVPLGTQIEEHCGTFGDLLSPALMD